MITLQIGQMLERRLTASYLLQSFSLPVGDAWREIVRKAANFKISWCFVQQRSKWVKRINLRTLLYENVMHGMILCFAQISSSIEIINKRDKKTLSSLFSRWTNHEMFFSRPNLACVQLSHDWTSYMLSIEYFDSYRGRFDDVAKLNNQNIMHFFPLFSDFHWFPYICRGCCLNLLHSTVTMNILHIVSYSFLKVLWTEG